MKEFNVYARYDVTLERGEGVYVFDETGKKYLDLYGGHGVISIGHSHPAYVKAVTEQVSRIGFYSNSIRIPLQEQLAEKLGRLSGYPDYSLFLCNSGAEANENAIKLASFHSGRKKVIAFHKSFHGRTSAALNITDNPKLSAPVNQSNFPVQFVAMNDIDAAEASLATNDVCAVIIEGIQGVGGLDMPTDTFLQQLDGACKKTGTLLILDEIQCGYGRTGKFFAHQHAGIRPDLITVAKGMGNGFPVAGVLIAPAFAAKEGMLGTTFGGNHLACAAAISVLDTIAKESLVEHANATGQWLFHTLKLIPGVNTVKGRGLMLGVDIGRPVSEVRNSLLFDHGIFTGSASHPHLIRILPPLNIQKEEAQPFLHALTAVLA